ncbi:MAG: sigma factor G inhibitor Gin [Desulfitobacteriaceae bacterium]
MSAKILPVCHACGRVPQLGLYDGFRLKEAFFCSDCENKMLTVEIGSPEYEKFFRDVRSLLFSGLKMNVLRGPQRPRAYKPKV